MQEWLQRTAQKSFLRKRWPLCVFLALVLGAIYIINLLFWDRVAEWGNQQVDQQGPLMKELGLSILLWPPLPAVFIACIGFTGLGMIWYFARQYRISEMAYAGLGNVEAPKSHRELDKQLKVASNRFGRALRKFADQTIKKRWPQVVEEFRLYEHTVFSATDNRSLARHEASLAKSLKGFAASLESTMATFDQSVPLLTESIYGYSQWLMTSGNQQQYEYENFLNTVRRLHQALGHHLKDVLDDVVITEIQTIEGKDIDQEINALCVSVRQKVSRLQEGCSVIQQAARESVQLGNKDGSQQ